MKACLGIVRINQLFQKHWYKVKNRTINNHQQCGMQLVTLDERCINAVSEDAVVDLSSFYDTSLKLAQSVGQV